MTTMTTITYETLQPLLAGETQSGRTLQFVFTCPASGISVTASAPVEPAKDVRTQVAHKAKRAALFSLRGPVADLVRSAFGRSNPLLRALGDVGSTVAYAAAAPSSQGPSFAIGEAARREAMVAAFMKVADRFVWDEQRAGWIAA